MEIHKSIIAPGFPVGYTCGVSVADVGFWLFWLLGLLFLGTCLAVTWWGLFGDRARGRRRCPRCWYDLSFSSGRTCPECGHTANTERSLFRNRRRLTAAMLAALAAALGVAWTIEQNRQRGWMSMVPTRVIILGLPLVGDENLLTRELLSRAQRRKLTDSQWRMLVGRCVRGDWRAPPVTPIWQRKYGPLLDQGQSSAPGELGGMLLGLPAWVNLQSDRSWPAGAPVCLDLTLRHWWWPATTACRVRLTPKAPPDAETIVVNRHGGWETRPFPLVIETPPGTAPFASPAGFDVVVERRGPAAGAAWEPVQRHTFDVAIEIEGSLKKTIQSVTEERLDQAVRAAFSQGVVKWESGQEPLRVRFDVNETRIAEFEGIAIGARVEIMHDDTLARRLDLWWMAGVGEPTDRGIGWRVEYEDDALLPEANDTDGRWRMVVRGDPGLAVRAGAASGYWAGQFTVPLKVRKSNRPEAPPKDWWIEAADVGSRLSALGSQQENTADASSPADG